MSVITLYLIHHYVFHMDIQDDICELMWMLFVSCELIKVTITRSKHHHLLCIDLTVHVFLFLTLFPEMKEWIELISADGWIGTFHYTESVMFAEITSQAY